VTEESQRTPDDSGSERNLDAIIEAELAFLRSRDQLSQRDGLRMLVLSSKSVLPSPRLRLRLNDLIKSDPDGVENFRIGLQKVVLRRIHQYDQDKATR
jgi:hypothetical protein